MCKFIQKGVLNMNDPKVQDMSIFYLPNLKIIQYLEIIKKVKLNSIESNTIEHIKEISNRNLLEPAYAIHALLKFVEIGKTDNYIFNFKSEYYKNLNYEAVNEPHAVRNYFLNASAKSEEMKKVVGDISSDNTLKEFFDQIWKWVKQDKKIKDKMKKFISEAFGINMSEKLMKNKLNKLIDIKNFKSNNYDTQILTKQIILHGAPGTGKTYTAENFAEECVKKLLNKDKLSKDDKKKYIKKVQFHPSFDYTDFVEGLRPAIIEKDNTDNSTTKTDKSPTFVRMDGILKKFCREIESNKDSDKLYFLLIDEINRADLSKVLGDLMYLMNDPQRSKKDKDEKKTIETPYSNMPTYIVDDNGNGKFLEKHKGNNKTENDQKEIDKKGNNKEDVFEDGFFLPDNLIIIGTMNDIDRSVDAFDFALRRRFVWIEADANTEAKEAIPNIITDTTIDTNTLITRLEELNKVISGKEGQKLGLSEKYHIGHAYAKNFDRSYDTLWENSIKPVLDDYCLGKKDNGFIKACENALKGKSQPDNQASSGN